MEDYQYLSKKKLIVYSIAKLRDLEEECTFERLVKECFDRFPKSFCFTRYPEWPDASKFPRLLRTLKSDDKLIRGSIGTRFKLTKSGEKYAQAVAKEIDSSLFEKKVSAGKKRKERKLLKEIKNSNEYKLFCKQGEKVNLNESQIRHIAFSTLETPNNVVFEKLKKLRDLANQAQENAVSAFLEYCLKRITDG